MSGRDPFALIPTGARLWLAAVLCLAPMGFTWTYNPGYSYTGWCISYYDGVCTWYSSYFTPGSTTKVSESPIRAFVLFAALAFVIVALRARTAGTLRLARWASGSLGFGILLALGHGSARIAILLALALALVLPLVARRPRPVPAAAGP